MGNSVGLIPLGRPGARTPAAPGFHLWIPPLQTLGVTVARAGGGRESEGGAPFNTVPTKLPHSSADPDPESWAGTAKDAHIVRATVDSPLFHTWPN